MSLQCALYRGVCCSAAAGCVGAVQLCSNYRAAVCMQLQPAHSLHSRCTLQRSYEELQNCIAPSAGSSGCVHCTSRLGSLGLTIPTSMLHNTTFLQGLLLVESAFTHKNGFWQTVTVFQFEINPKQGLEVNTLKACIRIQVGHCKCPKMFKRLLNLNKLIALVLKASMSF